MSDARLACAERDWVALGRGGQAVYLRELARAGRGELPEVWAPPLDGESLGNFAWICRLVGGSSRVLWRDWRRSGGPLSVSPERLPRGASLTIYGGHGASGEVRVTLGGHSVSVPIHQGWRWIDPMREAEAERDEILARPQERPESVYARLGRARVPEPQ